MGRPASDQPYTQTSLLSTQMRGLTVRYATKPGLPGNGSIRPSTWLLAEHIELAGEGRLLSLGCGHGAGIAALALSTPGWDFTLFDTSIVSAQMARRTGALNQLDVLRHWKVLTVAPLQFEPNDYDCIVIDLPKGRGLARHWLARAWYELRVGGHLYLAGPNQGGVKPAIQDGADLFGPPLVMAYKKGNRLVRWRRPEGAVSWPQWMEAGGITPGTWQRLKVSTPQGDLDLVSLPGVFSSDRLDEGTRLLLEHLPDLSGASVLDLGCGYGVIGIAAAWMGAGHVDLVDADLLALSAARENCLGIAPAQVTVIASDVCSAVEGRRYTHILTNPPFHSGQPVNLQVAEAFIQQGYRSLERGGQLWLVANRFLRYDRLMDSFFPTVVTLAETGKYHLLMGEKS
jgi:16S rRNA (guanine1207-N2)-methyltransferase